MAVNLKKKIDLTKKTKTVKPAAKSAAKVGKIELITKVAQKLDIPQKDAANVINQTIGEISDQLKSGNSVTIMDFGTFKIQKVKARKGRNVKTGEEMTIPAHKRVKFTVGKKLSEMVKAKK